MKYSEFITADFIACIESYLDSSANGFKEHELLSHLNELGFFDQLDSSVGVSLLLFQKHFLLFHVLYSIHQQRIDEKKGALLITALEIKALDYVDSGTQIGEVDRLSTYYLELDNLATVSDEKVDELLNDFWVMYAKNDKRGEALKVLGLIPPVSAKEIAGRFRQLASVHHPDKGGDKLKFQAINKAYADLKE